MSEQKQYPEWQRIFREAKATVEAADAKAACEAEEKKERAEAERQARLGAELAEVLALLGLPIVGEPPKTNKVVLEGGYEISLVAKLDRKRWNSDQQEHITFQLRVTKQAHLEAKGYEDYEREAWYQPSFNIINQVQPADLALFATSIDRVDREVESMEARDRAFLERQTKEKTEREARVSPNVAIEDSEQREDTLAQQLETLIRRIVREVMAERYEY